MALECGGNVGLGSRLPADWFALGAGGGHAGLHPGANHGELQLGENARHLEEGLGHRVERAASAVHRDGAENRQAQALLLNAGDDFAELLDAAREGDTIITLEVSRLSRSTQQLCQIIDIIREKRLCLQIVGSITIDCRNGQTDPMSEAFLQMAGVFSQLELAMIRARVKSGMANAKAKGKQIGRRPTTKDDIPAIFFQHYPIYASCRMNISELARVCGLSRPTVYKYLTLLK